jgi:ABC-type bacteriocin/lantibiotic exporter with double-glycine peptidase domain
VQRHLVVAYDRVRERNSEMLSSISEVVTGAETIRAYRAGGHFEHAANVTVKRRADAQIRTNVIGAFPVPSGEVFSVLTVSAVIAVGCGEARRAGSRPGR